MFKKLIFPLWVLVALGLFFYSFTQVDLSLTLSRASFLQDFQKAFQYVGWFNRPLSTYLYIALLIIAFTLYRYTLSLINKKQLERKLVIKTIVVVGAVLFLSYCAFSYDLFNYIFDAKIITHYHQNPYFHKALDYAGDPMLSFMRWTHRTYPYGPFWLVLTVPLSYVGFGIFVFTFYLFKLLMFATFIGSVLVIERIAKKLNFDPIYAMAAFALNPLVLIESLVSAHNDIVMLFFGLLSLLLFVEGKYVKSAIWLTVSILIKFATALMIPALAIRKFKKIKDEQFIYLIVLFMIAAVIFATIRTQFQPWYLLYVLPFTAFIQKKYFVAIPVILISLAGLLQYIPYLYTGNWDPPIPLILNSIMVGSIVLSLISIGIFKSLKK